MGKFVVVYFDNILVYSPSQETHLEHVNEFLKHYEKSVYMSIGSSVRFSLPILLSLVLLCLLMVFTLISLR
jgi:hypothetical protein